MISHIDATIEQILREELPESEYEINFDIPNKEWLNRISGNKPVINIYLYDIHENLQLRSNEWTVKKNKDGTYKKTPPDTRLDLYYVITVWSPATTEAVLEEHHIMSVIYGKLFEFTKIPRKYFQGDLKNIHPAPEIPISVASKDSFKEQGIGQFWSTLEQPWKPAIYLTVTAPISIQKHIKGKVVTTKILEYGQIGYYTLLKVYPYITETGFSKNTTQFFKVKISSSGTETAKWEPKGTKILEVKDVSPFNPNQKIVIIDGEHTEFAEIENVVPSEKKIKLKNKLLYPHPKVEIKVLALENPIDIKLAENLHQNSNSVLVKGKEINKLKTGDIIKLKDGSKENLFMVSGILTEQAGLEDKESYFQFGGIVINNAVRPSPLIGAKVELLDLSDKKISEVLTDEKGQFIFHIKENLSGKLKIVKEGYKEKIIEIPEPLKLSQKDLFIKLENIE